MIETPEYHYDNVFATLKDKLTDRKSFVLIGLSGRMLEVAGELELLVEGIGLTCRIYSRNRVVAAAATSLMPVVGIASLAAVAVHNIVTWNPDYEIGKDLTDHKIYVDYRK